MFWSSEFPTRSHTNRPVKSQKQARSLKFWIYKEEKLYYSCSKNKGADQLRSYCEANPRLFLHRQKSSFLMMWLIFYVTRWLPRWERASHLLFMCIIKTSAMCCIVLSQLPHKVDGQLLTDQSSHQTGML